MQVTEMLAPTLRETPAEAEIISHQLLLRAGFIRKSATGVYTYLPLAQRVLKKIMNIVREEMDLAGGQEIMLPIIQPAELWIESGRWNVYGKELIRFKDRHDRDFCLGPTHEEIITDLIRHEVNSYRQLPLMLYQIQNKYRDERRPRFGLMRGREFIMKDLYSFDRDEAGLDISYQKMYNAYSNIFSRFGLNFRPVEADSGAIGGSTTHEFMVLADSGEATIVYCTECDYAANIEIASCAINSGMSQGEMLALEKVHTPNMASIEEVATFLKVNADRCIKTMFYRADNEIIAVLVRGDRTVNEVKINKIHPCDVLEMASSQDIKELTGSQPGYVGPVGLKKAVKIYADLEVEHMVNAIIGANDENYHYINVNITRDFSVTAFSDLRNIELTDECPKCSSKSLKMAKGIEVGQVFKLGTKYSQVLKATFLDENGKEQLIVMGCYGIGVSRTMAAAVEQNYDENGIIWPVAIAPFEALIVPISAKDEDHMKITQELFAQLKKLGIEAVIDDRNERPGVKFKDADLIGYPIRVTIGKTAVQEGKAEVKLRTEKEAKLIELERVAEYVVDYIKNNK